MAADAIDEGLNDPNFYNYLQFYKSQQNKPFYKSPSGLSSPKASRAQEDYYKQLKQAEAIDNPNPYELESFPSAKGY